MIRVMWLFHRFSLWRDLLFKIFLKGGLTSATRRWRFQKSLRISKWRLGLRAQLKQEEAIKSSLFNGGRGSGGLKVRREHCAKGTRPQHTVVPFFSFFLFLRTRSSCNLAIRLYSDRTMNVSVLSGPYLLMTDLHSQLMTLNDLRTLGGQACLRLGCFAVAWGITVRRDRRAPHTAMPTAAFESILGWSLTSRCSGNGILNESQSKRQVTSPFFR